MGNFLDDLNRAVNSGEFNSDAAKKINEINKLANIVASTGNVVTNLDKRLKDAGIKTVSEEEVILANTEYENQMIMTKKQNNINKLVVTLIEIENMVKMSIDDMVSHINELEDNFAKEFETEDPITSDLFLKIEEIKFKYKNFINN
jgi:hypothetical protein